MTSTTQSETAAQTTNHPISEDDWAKVREVLTLSPLFLVQYERNGNMCAEFVPAQRAVEILDPDVSSRFLKENVLVLSGSSLIVRNITAAERIMIKNRAWNMG